MSSQRTSGPAARIKGMVGVREALRDLMFGEQSERRTDFELDGKRTTLNRVYDDFMRKFGPDTSARRQTASPCRKIRSCTRSKATTTAAASCKHETTALTTGGRF